MRRTLQNLIAAVLLLSLWHFILASQSYELLIYSSDS